ADADFAVHPADQRVWTHGIAPGESALLAPERLEGAPPSEQSFVFAAGALLHRLTTGRWPYAGTTPVAIRRSIERGLGELSSPAGLPLSDALRQVIRKCLAARQPDRYATIGALTDALLMASRLLTPTEEEAEPEPEQLAALRPEPRRTVWRTRVAVGVGVAAIIAAVATLIAAVGGVFAPPSESPIVALRTPAPGGGESAVGPELLRTVPGAPEPRQPAPRRPAPSAPGRGAAPLVSRPQARTAAPRAPSQPAVRYGRISVETWPPDAHPKVYLDEVYAGVAPHIISHVRPGERRLRLVAPGFATWEKAIGVSAGDHVTVIARLTPQRR
ncbi:MAG: PEGA domain-containing protein, partial [Armatimonadota bacterium]